MHVYAILHRSAALTLPEGVLSPLQSVVEGQLAAVVEPDLALVELQQDDAGLLQAVLAHDRVIRELFAQTTVLPLRFNTFPALNELIADLQTNQKTYLNQLAQLDGQAEFTLKLSPVEISEGSIAPNLKGKEYFLAKKQHYQEQQRQEELRVQEFNLIVQAIVQQYLAVAQPDSNQICILAQKQQYDGLQRQITDLQEQMNYWELHLGDALPPFHFVQG
ncbi:MAG: GvpL/GvpF family gas vesicle protein [Leptolyngbyaceae cyanobacterium bins.302]|nr:GvpL/GvpF family gas vesicle protein [Leptolyngbyaceae cyanobacterium bins.302]